MVSETDPVGRLSVIVAETIDNAIAGRKDDRQLKARLADCLEAFARVLRSKDNR